MSDSSAPLALDLEAVLGPDGGINSNIVKAEYAVRGQIYVAATKRKAEGKKVILTNVGNPHALGQKPITFPRQVLACVNYPELLDTSQAASLFPQDVIDRSRAYLAAIPGGTGAYQDMRKKHLLFISSFNPSLLT